MSILENMKVLPTPYWMSKMYNSPVGIRFIIASKQCAIKPLNQNIRAPLNYMRCAMFLV